MGRVERIQGLDVARSWAMLLALAAHAMVQVDMPMPSPLAGILIRTSTPIFILLFGAMIALVHLPRAERHGMRVLAERSWARALQCYLLFLANVVALWITTPYSFRYALLCATMLGSTPYAGILQYYTIMLTAMPLLILLIRRVPAPVCLAAAVAVHLAFPILKMVPAPPLFLGQAIWGRLNDLIIGTGTDVQIAGPSILHSLVWVFSGLALGNWLRSARTADEPSASATALLPIGLMFLVMGLWSLSVSAFGAVDLQSLSEMRLRNLNHPAYFFVVGGLALAVILASERMTRGRRMPDWLLVLGRRSLFAFGFGNVIISFWPEGVTRLFGTELSALALLCVVTAVIFAYDRALHRSRQVAAPMPAVLVGAVAGASTRFCATVAHAAVRRMLRLRARLAPSMLDLGLVAPGEALSATQP